MRKVTLLFGLLTITLFAFSQREVLSPLTKTTARLTKAEEPVYLKADNHNKNIQSAFWQQTFSTSALPAGWTVVDNTGNNFNWVVSNVAPGGNYTTEPKIASYSGGYFMSLRSDFYNSPPTGPATSIAMDAFFQTSSIDCSGKNSVALYFQQYFRYCCDSAESQLTVEVSNDNVTWVEYDVKGGYNSNDPSPNPMKVGINISSVAANQPNVYIRWHDVGNSHYFWMVDDIYLTEAPGNDLELRSIYPMWVDSLAVGYGYYSKIPSSQVMGIQIGAKSFNFGANDQTNVALNADFSDYNTSVFNTTGIALPTIVSCSTDSFGIDTPFTPSPTPKEYLATVTVTQTEQDENIFNNTDTISFAVSDSVYAHDYIMNNSVTPIDFTGTDGDFYGTYYYVRCTTQVNSVSVFIYHSSSSPTTGGAIYAKIYKWDQAATSWFEILASDIRTITTPADLNKWITIPFLQDGTSEHIAGGDYYVVGLEFYPGSETLYIGSDLSPIHNVDAEATLRIADTWYRPIGGGVPLIRLNIDVPVSPLGGFISAMTNVSCNGGSNGSATVTAYGGTSPYTYAWQGGGANITKTNLSAGSYTVTITDANSSTAIVTATINQPDVITSVLVPTDPTCYNTATGSIQATVTGGTPPYTYRWSNLTYYQEAINLMPGTYSVTIKDAMNCQVTNSATLTQPALIAVALDSVVGSNGNDGAIYISVSGGNPPYMYAWSNSATNQDPINLAPGQYDVTITDFNGCTTTRTYFVNDLGLCAGFSGSLNVIGITCNGAHNGSATVVISNGTAPITYLWSNAATSQSITVLGAGVYSVTATDANTCNYIGYASITEPAVLQKTYVVTNVTCHGDSDGSINMTVTGGTTPYTFTWSTPDVTEDISNLAAGTYNVIIRDAHNCSVTAVVTVTQPAAISLTLVPSIVTTIGGNNGSINLTVTGGASPYSYLWSNGETTQDIDSLVADTFSVVVTDAHGCTASDTTIVNEVPCTLTATAAVVNVSCYNGNNGSATVTAGGGTSPYTYLWNDPAPAQTTATCTALTAGAWIVTVTDAQGCTVRDTATISQPAQITITETIVNETYINANGSITLAIAGGTPVYAFVWSGPSPFSSTSKDINNLVAGTYSVTVTDSHNCTATETYSVTTGIKNVYNNNPISIYPNPTKGIVYVKNAASATISVYNILGKEVTRVKNNSSMYSLDLSKFSEGTYIVKVVTDKSIFTERVYLVK